MLSALYLPVTVMLIGLILRGVSFDLRVKADGRQKRAVEPAVRGRLAARRVRAGLDAGQLHDRVRARAGQLAVRCADRA